MHGSFALTTQNSCSYWEKKKNLKNSSTLCNIARYLTNIQHWIPYTPLKRNYYRDHLLLFWFNSYFQLKAFVLVTRDFGFVTEISPCCRVVGGSQILEELKRGLTISYDGVEGGQKRASANAILDNWFRSSFILYNFPIATIKFSYWAIGISF